MKSLKKQFAFALIAVLAVGAFTVGCKKSTEDKMKDAASDTKDAVKAAAEKTGDAIKDGAKATKDAVTNAVDSMTSTNK
jgi:hypothetical protein